MHRPSKTRKTLGVSLIELVISVGLFSIILLSLGKVVNASYNQYWESVGSLDVQKAVLYGTRLLIEDLTYTNSGAVETSQAQVQVQGLGQQGQGQNVSMSRVVFPTPDDLNGNPSFSSRGQLLWQSYTGYYVAPIGNTQALFRSRSAIPIPGLIVPIPSENGVTPDTMASIPGAKLILSDISEFDLSREGADIIKIRMSGYFQQRGLFTIVVENQVLPRN